MPTEVREVVKKNVLQALATETTRPSIAAQCINAIAGIEFIYEVAIDRRWLRIFLAMVRLYRNADGQRNESFEFGKVKRILTRGTRLHVSRYNLTCNRG